MGLLSKRYRFCNRCGYELEGGEEICPQCEFSPRQIAMKLTAYVLAGSFGLWFLTIALIFIHPGLGGVVAVVAVGLFGVALVIFLGSLVATPDRFGIFLR